MRRALMDRIAEIADTLARLDDPRLIDGFLRAILTPRELDDLSSRWELVKRLRRGDSQRTIARDLGVSLCKITRGSRELKARGSALRTVIDRHADDNADHNESRRTHG
jgi:TrpR family trp operon transcriptional repressor